VKVGPAFVSEDEHWYNKVLAHTADQLVPGYVPSNAVIVTSAQDQMACSGFELVLTIL
jgi:hypothetical protein